MILYTIRIICLTLTIFIFAVLSFYFYKKHLFKNNLPLLCSGWLLALRLILPFEFYTLLFPFVFFYTIVYYLFKQFRLAVGICRLILLGITGILLFSLFSGFYRSPYFNMSYLLLFIFFTGVALKGLFKRLKTGTFPFILFYSSMAFLLTHLGEQLLNLPEEPLTLWSSLGLTLWFAYSAFFDKRASNTLAFRKKHPKENKRRAWKREKKEQHLITQTRLIETGLLSTGILHEIKNIFFSMSASLGFAQKSNHPGMKEEALEIIESSCERGRFFLNQFLTKIYPPPGPPPLIDLKEELKEMIKIFKVNFRKEELSIVPNLESLKYPIPRADIEQILFNLIGNAAGAMKKSGQKTKEIRISLKKHAAQLILEIEDNGPGIPEELHYKLFTPGISGSGSSGIGLYLVKMTIEKYGGSILYLPLKEGSLFRIILPPPVEKKRLE